MTPADLIDQAAADGVRMELTAAGRLRLIGADVDVDRWLAVLAPESYRSALIAELERKGALTARIGPLANERTADGMSASPEAKNDA